ncbi:hypothetical protein GCM10009835_20640 [Planosporangium flavigriseum]|uniref:Uncharacterized protein n=1 Tax=Planosporangium flavigriseum TaxID=373681 RepID=A0A8J3PJR1_9ACTN|nr:hypothetical protein Pfl04_04960 [Planosporangium flavigriseum]
MTGAGVAAGAGSAQFGLAYGLGVIDWQPVRDATGESLWLSALTWAVWIAATSTVLGAAFAGSLLSRESRSRAVDVVSRTALALAAAIGALITVPLVMLPARAAQRVDTFQPEVTAGAYTVVGVIVGLVIAVVAVNFRVVATNIMASTAWVWIVAVVAVVDAVRANRIVGTAQLAAWQFTDRGWFRETLHLPGAFLMLGGALLVGVFAALIGDRRGDNRLCIAVSGTFGPLLVAAAYFLAAPKPAVRAEQLSAYLFAPYAVVAGLAGSVFVAVLGPLRPRRPRDAGEQVRPAVGDTTPATGGPTATSGEADLTEWTRTLATDTSARPDLSPTATQPTATRPTATRPTATRPTATRPTAAQPTATRPAPPVVPKQRKRRGPGVS